MLQRIRLLWYIPALLLLLASGTARAQVSAKVTWKVLTPTVKGAPGQVVDVKVQAVIESGWHMYTTKRYPDSVPGPQSTEITAGDRSVLSLAGRVKGTRPISKYDDAFEMQTEYWTGTAVLNVPVKIAQKATPGKASGWVNFLFQTCNESTCIPPLQKKLTFDVEVLDKQAMLDSAGRADSIKTAQAAAADTASHDVAATDTVPAGPKNDTAATAAVTGSEPKGKAQPGQAGAGAEAVGAAQKSGSLLALMLLMVLPALAALSTPCVWPMIPITVSFFTKRKQVTRWHSVRDAGLYALGIILTFTALGVIISAVFGPGGVNAFAASPITNFLVAGIFLVFALNLFGLFEIQIPTAILNKLNRQADDQSPWGVIMMGLVFSLTSFTCTFGVIGPLFISIAGGHDLVSSIIGTATFATVFAAPFFVLALFPSLLKSMPKSGGWLNSVKVVMGFIELAFAFKFVANADLVMGWEVFTRQTVLAIWVAVAVLTTVYLLGRFLMPHDTPLEKVGPVRLVFATMFLAVGFWLLTGLFGRPLGELDAQLPPSEYGAGNIQQTTLVGSMTKPTPGAQAEADAWIQDDFAKALKLARESHRPIFVDFTGYLCTNCRWMEKNMFPKKEVADMMNRFVLCRLYTDRFNEINQRNQKMMIDRYKTISLPHYVLITPSDSTVAQFSGMTRSQEEFITFLQKGLNATQSPVAMNAR